MYYAREVDPDIMTELGSIGAQQAKPTEHTIQKVKQFLEYAANHSDAILTYNASDMVLVGHSDASYLSEKKKPRSRAGGNLFMSNNTVFPLNNGSVLNISKIIKAVM